MAYQTGKTKGALELHGVSSFKNIIKERDIIKKFVIPISDSQDYNLTCDNDAAVIEFPAGRQIVVTSDVLIEGVHFLPSDPPELIAKKAIRVNLSDLAAMGAHPIGYTLCLTMSKVFDEVWMAKFVEGLSSDHRAFHISLIGGDITKYDGPLHISITALGDTAEGQALTRTNAQPGDRIYVTGTIGDAVLGLAVLKGELKGLKQEYEDYLVSRYHLPASRHILGQNLVQIAHAATDISDGLISDLGLICEASDLCAYVRIDRVPFSKAAQKAASCMDIDQHAYIQMLLAGGDDYELIFTASPGDCDHIDYLANRYNVPITCIGHLGALPETHQDIDNVSFVTLLDEKGDIIKFERQGYQHEWEKV